MKRQLYVVFTIEHPPGNGVPRQTGLLLEQLRYAGLVTYNTTDRGYNIAIPAPPKVQADTWCEMQIARMRSFGIVASIAQDIIRR